MDLPENAGTFRIIGVIRDAKFAGFALNKPASPMVFVPLAQTVNYKNDSMNMVELRSHFMGGIMLTTEQPPGALEEVLAELLAEVEPNLPIVSVRTLEQQVALSFDQECAVASLAGLVRRSSLAAGGSGSL